MYLSASFTRAWGKSNREGWIVANPLNLNRNSHGIAFLSIRYGILQTTPSFQGVSPWLGELPTLINQPPIPGSRSPS